MTVLRMLAPRIGRLDTAIAKVPPKKAEGFYQSAAWKALLARIIRKRGRRCEACGATHDAEGKRAWIIGDHIIERRDGGAELDETNIRLTCIGCHNRKTAKAREQRMQARHTR